MQAFSKKLVRTLLVISESSIGFTNESSFKCFKVIVYLLHLFGYTYSQYETKPLTRPELHFLAQFTQLSPGTFALLQYGNNLLTKVFLYLIVGTHFSAYGLIFYLSFFQSDQKWLYRVLNFFFSNFMWLFMTPFQEIAIGMIVCGKNSFLTYNVAQSDCQSNNPPIQYFFGIFGILLTTLSGFITVYFLRCYQFNQVDFSRKYSCITYSRLLLHQIIQICYYLYLPALDIIKHILTHFLLCSYVQDALQNFPFGFDFEAKFFTASMCSGEYIMILISIWLFSDLDASIIFLSFLAFQPIITTLALALNNHQRIKLIINYDPTEYNSNAVVYLEEVYRCANNYYYSVESKIQFLYIMKIHTDICRIPDCPCQNDPLHFIDQSNNLNWNKLYDWSQFLFTSILRVCLAQKEFQDFQDVSLKYSTFLQKYRNNPLLSYGILQDILFQQRFNRFKKGGLAFRPTFFFSHIISVIQARNIEKMTQSQDKQNSLNNYEKGLFENIKEITTYGEKLRKTLLELILLQIHLWNDLILSNLKSYDQLLAFLKKLHKKQLDCSQIFEKLVISNDTQLILRFKLIYLVCCDRCHLQIIKFEKLLTQSIIQESIDQVSCFKGNQFLQLNSLSLIGNISPQNCGLLITKMTDHFKYFFSFDENTDYSSITTINMLMPPFLGQIHTDLISDFVNQGRIQKTNKQFNSYIQNGQGFIEPVKICLNLFFPIYDSLDFFLVMAHLRKKQTAISDPSNLDDEPNTDGLILIDQNFRILNMTENIYNKVSSYLLSLKSLNDIRAHSNIFKMIPKLVHQLLLYYQEVGESALINGNQEIATFTDTLQINYDSSLGDESRTLRKVKPISLKERVKKLTSIKNILKEQKNIKKIQQTSIQCTVSQIIIKYLQTNEYKSLLFYEIAIKLKNEHFKILHRHNNAIPHQIHLDLYSNQIETCRQVNSLDNIEKSEIPIISQANADFQFDEGSINSLKSNNNSMKYLLEFQSFAKSNTPLKQLHDFSLISLLYVTIITSFVLTMVILRLQLQSEQGCIQRQFDINTSYILFNQINSLLRQSHIIYNNIELSSQKLSYFFVNGQRVHLEDIETVMHEKMSLYLNQWQEEPLHYNDVEMAETQFYSFGSSYSSKTTLGEYLQKLTQQVFYYKFSLEESLLRIDLLNSMLYNLPQYRQSCRKALEFCRSENSSQSIYSFELLSYLQYAVCLGFFVLLSRPGVQMKRLYGKYLNLYLQIDSETLIQELLILEGQEKYLKLTEPWNDERRFANFLYDQHSYLDVTYKSTATSKKLDQYQKLQKIKIPEQKLNFTNLLLLNLILLLASISYAIFCQSKFRNSMVQNQDNFNSLLYMVQFEMDLIDSLYFWDIYIYNHTVGLNFKIDYIEMQTLFEDLKSVKFPKVVSILDYDDFNSNLCNRYSCSYLQRVANRTLSGQILDALLNEGLLRNVQKILNLIQLHQHFNYSPTNSQVINMFFDSEYLVYFFWGNDVIVQLLSELLQLHFLELYQKINSNKQLDAILGILLSAILIIISFLVLYKQLRVLSQEFKVLRQTMILIPYSTQQKIMEKQFLKQLTQ